MQGKLQVQNEEPLLKTEGLVGGAMYKEYRTDDARLTIAILKKACELGAVCMNYVQVENFLYKDGKITGVTVHDNLQTGACDVYAHALINAAGPWADELRKKTDEKISKTLFLTKGVHVVIAREKLPLHHAIYFDVQHDNRMIFAIPRDEIIYIGTTDTTFTGDKENITVSQHDVNYLLDAVNTIFPSAKLNRDDVLSCWAGLRPLIQERGKSPSEVSRKDEIFFSPDGLITIAGGKLTGYRKMAEEVVNITAERVSEKTEKQFPGCNTQNIKLHGADFSTTIDEFIERRTGEAGQIGLQKKDVEYLVNTYGTEAEKIIETAFEFSQKFTNAQDRILFAELKYCVENEMTCTLSDFLIRRTSLLYFDKNKAMKICNNASIYLKELLHLTDLQMQEQIKQFQLELAHSATPKL
jgi:glycerol-3-phosphate dehydrogenase